MEQDNSRFKKDINKTVNLLEKYIRKYPVRENINVVMITLSYILYITCIYAEKGNDISKITLADIASSNDDLCVFIESIIAPELFEDTKKLSLEVDKKIFKYIAVYKDNFTFGIESTPESIIKLSNSILSINEGESVLDICSGCGGFIIKNYSLNPSSSYVGIEINSIYASIAKIRSNLVEGNIRIYNMDAFAFDYSENKFDKVFLNFPFGIKYHSYNCPSSKELDLYLEGHKPFSSDWYFVNLALKAIKDQGKATCIMTTGSLFNSTAAERKMREHFVESGFIEAVILLASNVFVSTAIKTAIVILSKGNKKIRFIDASDIFMSERRYNILSDEGIDKILHLLKSDSDISKSVSIDDTRKNDYSLYPVRYLARKKEYNNGVEFSNIIKSITRGAFISAKELDKISTDKPTSYKYLMLANIKDGIINDNLPYLTGIDDKYNKYCLKKNSLIMSKNGFPFKTAVVGNIKEGEKVLANGNLYVVELDETKADPYYVKAYFDSEEGISQLKSIVVGSSLPNYGINDLQKLVIPLPPLNEQHLLAEKYKEAQDEVIINRLRLEKSLNKMAHVFDGGKDYA